MLQQVAACCSVLQCVAMQRTRAFRVMTFHFCNVCSVAVCVAVCCSGFQCVAVLCSGLQCVAVCHILLHLE